MSLRSSGRSLSPSEAIHQIALVIQIFLDLLPHVKDGTIPTAEEGQGYCVLSHDSAVKYVLFMYLVQSTSSWREPWHRWH